MGAAVVGALWGLGEAGAVLLGGRLWIDSPLPLFALGALGGALVSAPTGALLARLVRVGGRTAGVWCGLAALAAVELTMAVSADPPPFQAAPWWSGSPVALVGGYLSLVAFAALGARAPRALVILPLALSLQALARSEHQPRAGAAQAGRPNVLIVTMDTVRADHLSVYGDPRVKTPTLDALAKDGVVFDNAFASIGATGPSHTTLFTGLGTWSHGVLLNGVPAPASAPTLAEALLGAGYRTGAFISAYVLEHKIGLGRGFQTYDDDLSGSRGTAALLPVRLFAAGYRRLYPDAILERHGGDTVDLALRWLEADDSERPWFLWVHLFDAHGPYAPPPPFDRMYHAGDGRDPAVHSMDQVKNMAWYLERSLAGVTDLDWVIAQYDGEISYVDAQIGRLLAAVDARHEDTLVVVLADHGESLGEHGVWFNHGDDLYDPTLHIPLLMRWPGKVPAGVRVPGVVEMVDVVPTLFELLALEDSHPRDGRSLVSSWSGGSGAGVARSMAFDREVNVRDRESGAIQRPTWRMVGLRGPSTLFVLREAEAEELYEGLPNERGYAKMPEESSIERFGATPEGAATLEALGRQAEQVLSAGAHGVDRSNVDLSEADREKLRALGYIE